MAKTEFIIPEWPAPPGVRAACTTRQGGASLAPYDSFNLASHVGDDPLAVEANRAQLRQSLSLPADPAWLEQVHGCTLVDAGEVSCPADASYSNQAGQVCAVLTADCLPVLLCSQDGQEVAAAHAGWRGLAGGVLEAAVAGFRAQPQQLMAWLGPAIGPQVFEVGDEVRAAFVAHDAQAAQAFSAARPGHWWCDLWLLARQRLDKAGVSQLYGGGLCTYTEAERFYSYRRDGRTGRMATLIWRQPQ